MQTRPGVTANTEASRAEMERTAEERGKDQVLTASFETWSQTGPYAFQ